MTFRVSDGKFSDEEAITITVANVNRPPVLTVIGNKTVNEGVNVTFTVSATDPDGDTLTYGATGLPSGATFNGQTFAWTPNFTQSGTYSVTFTVSDGSLNVFETIAITVADVPFPDLVVTAISGPASGTRGGMISLTDTVVNQGGGSAASFTVGLYLSTDATITTADTRIGTHSISSLAAGATSIATTTVTIPRTLKPKTYYIGAIADYNNSLVESNEANNALAGNKLVVR